MIHKKMKLRKITTEVETGDKTIELVIKCVNFDQGGDSYNEYTVQIKSGDEIRTLAESNSNSEVRKIFSDNAGEEEQAVMGIINEFLDIVAAYSDGYD